MTEIKNFVSKILYTSNIYHILTYVDIDGVWSNEKIVTCMNVLIKKNPILKRKITEKNGLFFFKKVKTFKLTDYYNFEYTKQENFNNYIPDLLNVEFTTESKWKSLWCVDKEAKKTRLFFKIHHAYADGYKVIAMLSSFLITEEKDLTKKFKRTNGCSILKKIYYYIVGTILLFLMNIRVLSNILFNITGRQTFKSKKTAYIICKPLNLYEIKTAGIARNFTVNDFLYALMVKTDRLYQKKDRIITSCSPINVSSGVSQTNNICIMVNQTNNAYDNSTLLKRVNSTFNNYKYSWYIPILNSVINKITSYINLDRLLLYYNNILDNCDYIFSNVIGPTSSEYNVNIHFLLTAKNNEIIYNIISSGNRVNIICSFKEGIIADKGRFEQCIYTAFDSLMENKEK